MFDLNDAVATWRRDLARTTHLPRPALDELESHFLDDIDIQMEDGVDAERAYLMAIERLGEPKALQREFEKNDQGKRWLFAGARLGLAGYMLHQLFVPTIHWALAIMALGMGQKGVNGATLSWTQRLDLFVNEAMIFLMAAGDLIALGPIALLGILLAKRSRQKGWTLTFGSALVLAILSLVGAWDGVLSSFNSTGYIFLIALLITSIFTVYPPSLPDALDRLRRT
ncbi:MAG: hypothetical protein RhofKO_08380 [Rhodothermales bacterium]